MVSLLEKSIEQNYINYMDLSEISIDVKMGLEELLVDFLLDTLV